ncbi:MAG: hypothetical protein VX473_01285 [Candidatus Thermoplasmatota archaeon]|nr:hypothetical protein [Candidatus Thermoplasmatota archaeon]
MSDKKDAWWGPVSLLTILIAICMDLVVLNYSGGSEFSSVLSRIILGFTMSFGVTCLALLLVSLGAIHKHARWKEQVIGLTILSGLALYATYWQMDGSIDLLRADGVILLTGATAMLAAFGLVFGLLLALATGRKHIPDPLIEMESTGGDVPVELEV